MTDPDTPPRRPISESTDLIPIHRVEDIPDFATEAEAAEFYDTHCLGLIWDQLEDVTVNPPWGDTPPRPTPRSRWRSSRPYSRRDARG